MYIQYLLIPILSLLNMYRGGAWFAEQSKKYVKLHPRYQVTIILFLVLLLFVSVTNAAIFSGCYLISNIGAWGRWFDLGRLPDDFVTRNPNWLEKIIGKLPNDHLRFLVRHYLFMIPAIILISPIFIFLPPLIVLAYEIGWRYHGTGKAIRTGEAITGSLWGLFFAIVI